MCFENPREQLGIYFESQQFRPLGRDFGRRGWGVGVDGVFGYLKQDCQRFASIPTVGKINKPPGNTREIRDD